MDKLTLFCIDLATNKQMSIQFNAGASEAEIRENRKGMLIAAGVENIEEILELSSYALLELIDNKLAEQPGNSFAVYDFLKGLIMSNEFDDNNNVSDAAETICKLIAENAQAHPKQVAIIDGEKEVCFEQLLERTNSIAYEIAERGIDRGALIAICMSRTWELVATMLGVLRAGCAYVPLDPDYPEERIRYIVEHSKAAAVIVDNEYGVELCKGMGSIIRLSSIAHSFVGNIKWPEPDDLAYVIYTSGSTGMPKGVAVEHRNIVSLSQSMRGLLKDEELKGVLAATSVCFDPSVLEILGTLSLGGKVILARNALQLPDLPRARDIRTCIMVPSSMQAVLASDKLPDGIQCIVFGGEILKLSLVEQLWSQVPGLRVINVYGPTEDTVYSTYTEVTADTKEISIGKPVLNSRAYILDASMKPVPVGIPGELYLAGNKLARGYLHDKQLTQERFVSVKPNDEITDERLYKTGDLCQWQENGEIQFLGRIDQQIKIRGFRVELGEIESTLESMPGIEAAVADVVTGGAGQKILVMYIICPDKTVTEIAVKEYLSKRLPKYMVPQVVVYLDELPILPNGKLDRNRLPKLEKVRNSELLLDGMEPDTTNHARRIVLSLSGRSEEQHQAVLAIIQNEVANLLNFGESEKVAPDMGFEAIGIDSLTTVELGSRLGKVFEIKPPIQAIVEHPAPSLLTRYIVKLLNNNSEHDGVTEPDSSASDSLANFQSHIQSSHPTFQAAKVSAWSVTDKGTLVQEVMRMVNGLRRNPYSKILRTGSGTRGTVTDAYSNEEREAIIWTTNLYLGLNRDEQVIAESRSALERFGTGMGTSAAASGLTDLHLEFETAFAELVGKQGACLFPTGYTANVGVVAGLLGKNDVVVIDQLCHASIVDGARLCGATIRTFQHNNASDLESVLASEASPYRTILVVLEGVYSMGEGAAPVAEIVHAAKKYNALVLVDEAHSFGFYGARGAGICAAQGVTDQVDFIMTTLSKALGSLGGVIAARKEHIDLLKSSARAYIFQASVSPADIAAALTALRRLSSDDSLRERLWDTTRYMRERFTEAGYDLGTGDGPIVTPHFSDKDKLYAIVQELYQRGVQTSAVTYPIVEVGRGRLRFICSASHTRDDVDKTLDALIQAERHVDDQSILELNDTEGLHLFDIEGWGESFSRYLRGFLRNTPDPVPELTISFAVSNAEQLMVLTIKDRVVTLSAGKTPGLPSCALTLLDNNAAAALCSSDVQKLLHCICEGGCLLNGQTEPFVWLIARMAEQQRQENTIDTFEHLSVGV